MPVKRASNLAKAKCDTLYSLIIRSAGECLRCGYRCPCETAPKAHTRACKLTTSHIVGRRYSATRTDEKNAQALCYSDHAYFTDWPREFSHFITETIGSDEYDRLKTKAQTITKVDWNDELERLRVIARNLEIIK